MDMKLELVPVPVSDVDRAKAFYVEQAGFNAGHDVRPNDGVRIVQLSPPGSACSIVVSTGLPEISGVQPGSVRALSLFGDAGVCVDFPGAASCLPFPNCKISSL